ncbi:MAG: DUF3854 domain-containing protein [Proteobacteria bacterium]|nr:DUF3854 domain-containing protein [Pseudomonadota bacterium]
MIKEYSYFLNGYNPNADTLAKQALEDMQASGLSPETLEAAGIRLFSGNSDELKKRLGFVSINSNSILKTSILIEFPFFDQTGNIAFYEYKPFPSIDGRKYLHPLGTPAYPYISLYVWQVADKTSKPVWVTEGTKKALKLLQHGRKCISLSGVWNFRAGKDSEEIESKSFWRELETFSWKGRTVYIAFDSDLWTNSQVRHALYELAFKLIAKGAIIRFPQWHEEKGIDDHLADTEDVGKELHLLEGKALPIDKFITFDHKDEIIRALSEAHDMDDLSRESLINTVAKKFNIRPKRLSFEIMKRTKSEKAEGYTENEKQAAITLLSDPALIQNFLKVCHKRYIGREKTLILVKLATLTRHLNKGLSIVLSGSSSSGKSELIGTVLKTVDPKAVENFSRTSAQYLEYRTDDLAHKIIVYHELNGVGQTAQTIRTALTEGELVLGTVQKNAHGTMSGEKIEKDTRGLVILSTHTGYKIDYELSTRVLMQEITHDEGLARQVYSLKAGSGSVDCSEDFNIWQVADSLIEPKDVEIPYINALAELFPTKDERYMRDFDKVVSLVKASALFYCYQREQTQDGTIIANENDYKLVYSLSDAFTQSSLFVGKPVIEILQKVESIKECTRDDLLKSFSYSEKTLTRYISQAVGAGCLEIEGRGKKQKLKVLEIPEPVSILPKPEDIFKKNTPLSCVRLSNLEEAIDNIGSKSDTGFCPIISNMSKRDNKPLNMEQSDKSDKGGCPIETGDNKGSTPLWTNGQQKESEIFSDVDFMPETDEIPEVELYA